MPGARQENPDARNQKAGTLLRTRPGRVDDLHYFCFYAFYYWRASCPLVPHHEAAICKRKALNTESGSDYTKAHCSGSGRLDDASYLQLRLSQARTPLKNSAPKTLSSLTPCFCFCYRALLLQLFIVVVGAALSHCFCCCALRVLQWSCQIFKTFYYQ